MNEQLPLPYVYDPVSVAVANKHYGHLCDALRLLRMAVACGTDELWDREAEQFIKRMEADDPA